FLQNILDLYFKHFKLSEDVVNRILQVVLDLQHFKSSLFIFAATILQSSSAIHHISNIDNYVHQIIKFQSILITSSHSLWSSQSFGHQKGVCPWLTENHFNSQYLLNIGLVKPLAPREASRGVEGLERRLVECDTGEHDSRRHVACVRSTGATCHLWTSFNVMGRIEASWITGKWAFSCPSVIVASVLCHDCRYVGAEPHARLASNILIFAVFLESLSEALHQIFSN
ncbi:hypothetical protein Tco_1077510, partial [Tanacetum coccineum]